MKPAHKQKNIQRALALDYLESHFGNMTDADAIRKAIALSNTPNHNQNPDWPREARELFRHGNHASSVSKGRKKLKRLRLRDLKLRGKVKGYVLTDGNSNSK